MAMTLKTPSKPVNLPLELWERVFLRLPPVQVIKLREVNRNFRGAVDGSPQIQYLIDLYAAGLEVGYQDPSLTLVDRREQLNRYRSHWDSLRWVQHTSLPLPSYRVRTIKGGVLCLILSGNSNPTTDYRFMRLPSVLRGIPLKEWTLRGLPNSDQPLGLLPEEDLLVIFSPVENRRTFIIRLLRMSDGQPHPSASVPIINGPDYQREWSISRIADIEATSSRLAIVVPTTARFGVAMGHVFHLFVWDWKTGVEYVDILRYSLRVQFVDEYRIFGVSNVSNLPSRSFVTLLDTSTPAEDPQNPSEVEFELDSANPAVCLLEGSQLQGAMPGSPFRTNRGTHVLCISYFRAPERDKSFVIDYESICTIASQNKSSLRISWDLWKHKTTQIGHYTGYGYSIKLVGPRALVIGKIQGSRKLRVWWYDFTPGARRFVEQSDLPLEVIPSDVIHHATLTEMVSEWRGLRWVVSEDNLMDFRASPTGGSEVLRMWTF